MYTSFTKSRKKRIVAYISFLFFLFISISFCTDNFAQGLESDYKTAVGAKVFFGNGGQFAQYWKASEEDLMLINRALNARNR